MRVREGEGRVGLVLDLPQREELLCLGAQRLLHRPLLRRAAPHPELTHDHEDDQERRKGGADAQTHLAVRRRPACASIASPNDCSSAVSRPA